MIDEIVCSLSGITPTDETIMFDPPKQPEYLPVGWIKVTIERKYPNPEWIKLQNVKKGLVEAALTQIPEEHRNLQRQNVELQVEAQYAQLEATEKYKMTVIDKETVFISPPEADEEIMEEYENLMELLGIDFEDDEQEQESEVQTAQEGGDQTADESEAQEEPITEAAN